MSEPHFLREQVILLSQEYHGLSALIVNSSREMAHEMTLQLAQSLPQCSIMYAPTIELAKCILRRREVDLVISSPRLPDGSVHELRSVLEKIEHAPDVVVVGQLHSKSAMQFARSGYKLCSPKQFLRSEQTQTENPEQCAIRRVRGPIHSLRDSIKTLGADIRNDLNNPLQAITAMVFVAKASGSISETTMQALAAIDSAAKNMAQVVERIEDQMCTAVDLT